MKHLFWSIPGIVLSALAASCAIEGPETIESEIIHKPVFARIESIIEPETRVYADDHLNVLWNSDDRISLFNRSTDNQEYRFAGDSGTKEGAFKEENPGAKSGGKNLDLVYSVYPYESETQVDGKGNITLNLPSKQPYGEQSFGNGANTMVSVTGDVDLLFKNLCGYLVLKLYGKDISVASVSLQGKKEEPLAGPVSVTADVGTIPSFKFAEKGCENTLTLACEKPIRIGSTEEKATVFTLVVPPTTFSEGFTVTVTDENGEVFKRATSTKAVIERNTTFRMKPLELAKEPTYQVTNTYIQKYMDEVYYADMDFSGSALHGSPLPGGCPSVDDEELPPTIRLEWEKPGSSAGKISVKLWDEEWSRVYELSEKSYRLDVTNLVPDTRYFYEVTSKNNGTLDKGSFRTTGALHQIYFTDDVRNGRDMGGWKTLDGKTVRYRKIYRGGQIGRGYMNDNGRKEMIAEGIRAEIDLREKRDVPSSSPLGSDYAFCAPGFDRGYVDGMLKGNPEGVLKCFTFLVDCLRNNQPVYFHCAAGRDRTGTLSILILGVLGVREGDLAKDYELTYFSPEEWSMQKIDGQMVYNHTRDVETYRETVEYLASFDNTSFKAGVEKYLLSIGVPQQDIEDLRSMMLK